ncbi:YciI family protein [Umezawaea endophytica]|uniref:YciI family protein n=1 Tax=Umezawaea endophytica TaxID=1654476 RepID=A0A9X3AJ11_9PSEU|nr:YciI family protein [Umezawaea endophytica]MCS7483301.1 YciI family protein [Umezawaea endophytica]
MRYMLLICAQEGVDVGEVDPIEPWLEFVGDRRVDGSRLRPSGDATSVQVRGGDVLLSDGPFAETKEQVAGFDLVECADLDEALEIAGRHPVAKFGTVEVRPLWED